MGTLEWDVYNETMLMNMGALDEAAQAFREAAEAFGEIVARPEVGKAWEQPSALQGLSVGDIVGHVNAAIGWLTWWPSSAGGRPGMGGSPTATSSSVWRSD